MSAPDENPEPSNRERRDAALLWLLELALWERDPRSMASFPTRGAPPDWVLSAVRGLLDQAVELRRRWWLASDLRPALPENVRPNFEVTFSDLITTAVAASATHALRGLGAVPEPRKAERALGQLRRIVADWFLEAEPDAVARAVAQQDLRARVAAFLAACGLARASHEPRRQIAKALAALEQTPSQDLLAPVNPTTQLLLALQRSYAVTSVPRALEYVLQCAGLRPTAASLCADDLTRGRRTETTISGRSPTVVDAQEAHETPNPLALSTASPAKLRPARVVFTQPTRFPLSDAPEEGLFTLAATPFPSIIYCIGEAAVGLSAIVSTIQEEFNEPTEHLDASDLEAQDVFPHIQEKLEAGAWTVFVTGFPRTEQDVQQLPPPQPARAIGIARFVSPGEGHADQAASYVRIEEQIILRRYPYAVLPGDDAVLAPAWLGIFAGVGHDPAC